ncbi:MAG: amidohydrolase family protein [Magnetococcales bacterium]|nr:amidohydrolase family protein [Magnetococcales bacterium]
MHPRRRFMLTGLGSLLALTSGCKPIRIWNPCHERLPQELLDHPLVRGVWHDIDPEKYWDCHLHIAGTGDSGSGITLAPEMTSLWHPFQNLQRHFYLNAGCADSESGSVDKQYIDRLLDLMSAFPPGAKVMLFAFDRAHDEAGHSLPERSAFYVPNAYARALAERHPSRFEWVASIHPYRSDAVAALEEAYDQGARAVKWLPPAMGIDPASPRCQPFYQAMARLGVPLITHAGEEKAVHGMNQTTFGNPLRLRRALDNGVRTVIAHCASIGEDEDFDHTNRHVPSFTLFTRLMENPAHRDLLHGDISAITLRNRDPAVVRTLLERTEWHPRLLNGSDYPLPGILPLISPTRFVKADLLDEKVVPVLNQMREYHPLLADLLLKRHLSVHGTGFSPRIFETRDFFVPRRHTSGTTAQVAQSVA